MKMSLVSLLLLGFLLPVLAMAAEGADATVVSSGGKNIQGKAGNPHPAQSTNEYLSRGAKQKSKPHAVGDICLYGPRDPSSVVVQAARTTAR
jgi:hypothetical protein